MLRVAQKVEPLRSEVCPRHVAPLARGLSRVARTPLKLRQVADWRKALETDTSAVARRWGTVCFKVFSSYVSPVGLRGTYITKLGGAEGDFRGGA